MAHQVDRSSLLTAEIERARAELDGLAHELALRARLLEERTYEMLVAETPIAARRRGDALADHERVRSRMAELSSVLDRLTEDRDGRRGPGVAVGEAVKLDYPRGA
jgi:hypothetical protein